MKEEGDEEGKRKWRQKKKMKIGGNKCEEEEGRRRRSMNWAKKKNKGQSHSHSHSHSDDEDEKKKLLLLLLRIRPAAAVSLILLFLSSSAFFSSPPLPWPCLFPSSFLLVSAASATPPPSDDDELRATSSPSRQVTFHHQIFGRALKTDSQSLKIHHNIPDFDGRALLGSAPPKCIEKCAKCTPCSPVRVPIHPGRMKVRLMEYYPEAWRCKCRNKLYMP